MIFSHANGFPASTYRKLFTLLGEGHPIHAIEKFGHNPHLPVTNNWPFLVDELLALLHENSAKDGSEKSLLVGHSMGGYLSLIAAHKVPHLVSGVILLDSPLVTGWRATALGLGKLTSLDVHFSPAKVSKKRRQQWDSVDAAYSHFVAKHVFARWDREMLRDYVTHGTVLNEGKRILAFDRDIETKIYRTLPDNLASYIREPFPVPLAFIGGSMSEEIKQVGMAATKRATQGRVTWVPGTHLFPMERPADTAKAIKHFANEFAAKN